MNQTITTFFSEQQSRREAFDDCMLEATDGMARQPSAATGTVTRTSTLERYAQEAGFSQVKVLPIDNFFFRIHRLYPQAPADHSARQYAKDDR